jgi:hypothetical protein
LGLDAFLGCLVLVYEQEEPGGIERYMPWLRLDAQRAPKFFGDVGLEMGRIAGLRGGVEAQIERHLVRRFAGGYEPTWKGVFAD